MARLLPSLLSVDGATPPACVVDPDAKAGLGEVVGVLTAGDDTVALACARGVAAEAEALVGRTGAPPVTRPPVEVVEVAAGAAVCEAGAGDR
jgi:hypothetical protein